MLLLHMYTTRSGYHRTLCCISIAVPDVPPCPACREADSERASGQQQPLALAEPPSFPAAAQPDIVRAHQKDDLYLQTLTDSCHDAVRSLLGPRRALLWSRSALAHGPFKLLRQGAVT